MYDGATYTQRTRKHHARAPVSVDNGPSRSKANLSVVTGKKSKKRFELVILHMVLLSLFPGLFVVQNTEPVVEKLDSS